MFTLYNNNANTTTDLSFELEMGDTFFDTSSGFKIENFYGIDFDTLIWSSCDVST